jgi:S-adenosylmethionine synthetase
MSKRRFITPILNFKTTFMNNRADIAMGVDSGDNKDEGAGDQGLMFGYACDETDVLMPAAIHYSHQILKDLATVRKQDADSILGPDSKSQISLVYDDTAVQRVCIRWFYQRSILKKQHRPIFWRW